MDRWTLRLNKHQPGSKWKYFSQMKTQTLQQQSSYFFLDHKEHSHCLFSTTPSQREPKAIFIWLLSLIMGLNAPSELIFILWTKWKKKSRMLWNRHFDYILEMNSDRCPKPISVCTVTKSTISRQLLHVVLLLYSWILVYKLTKSILNCSEQSILSPNSGSCPMRWQ